jgi:hypothetical protein
MKRLIQLLIFSSSLFLSTIAFAGAEFIDYSGKLTTDEIFDLLDNLNWIPDGADNNKNIYVISAPWCSVSQKFYENTRSKIGEVQFRWLMAGSNDSDSLTKNQILTTSRDPKKLSELYRQGSLTGKTTLKSEIESTAIILTWNALKATIMNRFHQNPGFPTAIFYNGSEWEILSGLPNEINQLTNKVQDRSNTQKKQPLCEIITSQGIQEIPTAFKPHTPKGKIYIYAYPSTQSLKLVSLTPDFAVDAAQTIRLADGSRWIKIIIFENNLGGWAKLDDFVL